VLVASLRGGDDMGALAIFEIGVQFMFLHGAWRPQGAPLRRTKPGARKGRHYAGPSRTGT